MSEMYHDNLSIMENYWYNKALYHPWVLFHGKNWKRVVARNDHTVEVCPQSNGSSHTYAKVEEKYVNEVCSHVNCCT